MALCSRRRARRVTRHAGHRPSPSASPCAGLQWGALPSAKGARASFLALSRSGRRGVCAALAGVTADRRARRVAQGARTAGRTLRARAPVGSEGCVVLRSRSHLRALSRRGVLFEPARARLRRRRAASFVPMNEVTRRQRQPRRRAARTRQEAGAAALPRSRARRRGGARWCLLCAGSAGARWRCLGQPGVHLRTQQKA